GIRVATVPGVQPCALPISAAAESDVYRLGDYFESVELLPDEPNNKLSLTFHARQGVDSHWKFLIATVLRSIGNRFAGISVEFPHIERASRSESADHCDQSR